jgi:hypothetical protein
VAASRDSSWTSSASSRTGQRRSRSRAACPTPGIRAIAPPKYVNAVAARVGLQIPLYRPGRSASRVKAPHLFCICDHDSVAPAKAAHSAAARSSQPEVRSYPIGHFDVYVGEAFEQAVADQTEFLVRHMMT